MLLLSLTSCATNIPDVPVITRISPTEGFYVYTVSDKEGVVSDENLLDGKTFLDYVIEGVIVPADSYSKIKAFIIKMCKKYKECGVSWERRLERLEKP